jgi:hypothetical protein
MRRALGVSAVVLVGFAGGCRRRPAAPAPVAAPGAPAVQRFRPPADGRLTQNQVVSYRSLRRSARFSAAEDASGADGNEDARWDAQIQAARRAGLGPDELVWVQQKVAEARIAIAEARARRANVETYKRTIASLNRVLAATTDPQTRRILASQITDIEREQAAAEREARAPVDPALAANEEIVERYLSPER